MGLDLNVWTHSEWANANNNLLHNYAECSITLKQKEMGVTKNPSALAKTNLNTTTQSTLYH